MMYEYCHYNVSIMIHLVFNVSALSFSIVFLAWNENIKDVGLRCLC
jgi:hypothetical protein